MHMELHESAPLLTFSHLVLSPLFQVFTLVSSKHMNMNSYVVKSVEFQIGRVGLK